MINIEDLGFIYDYERVNGELRRTTYKVSKYSDADGFIITERRIGLSKVVYGLVKEKENDT